MSQRKECIQTKYVPRLQELIFISIYSLSSHIFWSTYYLRKAEVYHMFPIVTITNYHQLSNLKDTNLLSYNSRDQKSENRDVSRASLCLEAVGENLSLFFPPSFQRLPVLLVSCPLPMCSKPIVEHLLNSISVSVFVSVSISSVCLFFFLSPYLPPSLT